jgi:hypothetical protein
MGMKCRHLSTTIGPHSVVLDVGGDWSWKDGFDPGAFALGRDVAVFEEECAHFAVAFVFEERGGIDQEERIGIDEYRFVEGRHEDCESFCGPAF